MEKIIKQYGKFALAAAALFLALTIVFTGVRDDAGNQGLFAIAGANIGEHVKSAEYGAYTDFDTYAKEGSKSFPEITYAGTNLVTGRSRLGDHIGAADHAGNALQIKINSIRDWNGTELMEGYDQNTTEMEFVRPGIYEVTVSAVDSWNRKSICTIRIPVNQG